MSRDHLRGVAEVVGLGVDDLAGVRAEPGLQPGEVVLAVRVVLVEDADLRARLVREDVVGVELGLGRVVGLPAERPWLRRALAPMVDAVPPVGVAGGDEHLRHLVLVEVVPRREDRRGAEAADDGEDVVLLDELRGLRHRLGWVVLVVEDDVCDLAVEDSAVCVDVRVVRRLRSRDCLVGRSKAGERERPADHDLLLRYARRARVRGSRCASRCGCGEECAEQRSYLPPVDSHAPSCVR